MTYQAHAEQFLAHVFSGDMQAVLDACHDDVRFISTRPTPSDSVAAYGTHQGKDGALRFFDIFAQTLIAGEFHTEALFAQGHHVAMYGRLRHTARATGRIFESDWALIMRFDDAGTLVLYHFYEDTAALEWALGVSGM